MNLKICPLVQGWTLLKVHSHQNSIDTVTYYNPKVFDYNLERRQGMEL